MTAVCLRGNDGSRLPLPADSLPDSVNDRSFDDCRESRKL